jgi:glutathione synthase/RimK-type ligase-like ATP-grasp enzyme
VTRVLLTHAGGAYGLGVARSLRAADRAYHVIATDPDRFSLQRAEGHERHSLPSARSQEFVPALIELIRSTGTDFVWPGQDSDILAIARNRDRLGARTFLPPTQEVEICADKMLSYMRWRECAVPVPDTVKVNDRDDLVRAFDQFGGEVWLRAVTGAGGRGALGTDSLRRAEAWLEVHAGWGLFTAARWIKGGQRLSWESVWANGALIAVQGRRQLVQGYQGLTLSRITGVPGVNQWGTPPEADSTALAAIQAISPAPQGNYGVDMVCDADGAPYVTEINVGRYSNDGLIHWPDQKINAADLAVRLGLGEAPPFEPPLMHPKQRDNLIIYGLPAMPLEVSPDQLSERHGP